MAARDKFSIGLVQMACSTEPAANLEKAIGLVGEAAKRGAKVICLPELFRTQYFCREEDAELFELAEAIPGPTTEAIGKVAGELRVTVIAPLFERRAAGLYHNTAAIVGPEGKLDGIYRTIRSTTKNFISRRGTWDFWLSKRRRRESGCWFAGTSGIRKGPG
jgi:N-carbamoylputrescine amidase